MRVALTANATLTIQLACSARFAADRPFALVPSFTAPAGPLGLAWCGFEPRFVDIDPVSWHPDVRDAERVLAEHPDEIAGILLTTTFGAANTDIGSWEALARRHDLSLVIDSAAGFGSSYPSGESLGARGTCEIFSLHATKPLPIGEGGAVASRDADLIDVIESTKNFGYDRTRRSVRLGTNAKLPELSAALGLRQLEGYPDRLARRRAVLAGYHEQLAPLGVQFQPENDAVGAGVRSGADADRGRAGRARRRARRSRDRLPHVLRPAGPPPPHVRRQRAFRRPARHRRRRGTDRLAPGRRRHDTGGDRARRRRCPPR